MDSELLRGMGLRIAQLRRSHKMTQASLAEILDISTKHVSHVERGCASLSLRNLIELSQLFHCSLDYIIFGRQVDPAYNRLPDTITKILHSENEADIERLERYLQIYADMYEGNHS